MTAKLYSAQAQAVGAVLHQGDGKVPSTLYEEIRRMP